MAGEAMGAAVGRLRDLQGRPGDLRAFASSHREASRVRLILSASRRLENAEDSALAGILNRYLHWREIQCYGAEGIALFDLGGIEDDSSPITKFKLSFGGFEKVEHSFVLADRVTLAAHSFYRRLQRWYKQPRR